VDFSNNKGFKCAEVMYILIKMNQPMQKLFLFKSLIFLIIV